MKKNLINSSHPLTIEIIYSDCSVNFFFKIVEKVVEEETNNRIKFTLLKNIFFLFGSTSHFYSIQKKSNDYATQGQEKTHKNI